MSRIVLKVGSAILSENMQISSTMISNIVSLILDLKQKYEVVLVSSGAVLAGYSQLKLDKSVLENKQALAAIGQPLLMNKFRLEFAKYGQVPAQILLTASNLNTPAQNQKIKNTLNVLLQQDIIPIVNENDATAVEELVVGDNDQLSAYLACSIEADMLVILSDIDAYYDSDPHKNSNAKAYKKVENISKQELDQLKSPNHDFATGGIVTKLKAASYMLTCKRQMFLASGFDLENVRSFLLDNQQTNGTLFSKSKG